MNKGNINYWLGISLLIAIISFFFYKTMFSDRPLGTALENIEEIHDLQVQLHRDLLRYRSDQIRQYDTLNQTLAALDENIEHLVNNNAIDDPSIVNTINSLNSMISDQAMLVEDFKTHHSILQNSLFYIFNVSTDLYSLKPKTQSKEQLRITAELITLLLEFNENPQHNIASKIYPLIDYLNIDPDTETNALINHSLMIIERLPEIDDILKKFNSLNVENQVLLLKKSLGELRAVDERNAQIFNFLLFLFTIYLIFYIVYIFINLQKKQAELTETNDRLNSEIELRTKTEKALYQLVDLDKIHHTQTEEDRILYLLNALCTALDMEYAYISRINHSGLSADIIGLLDHGMFRNNIHYSLENTPCEEIIRTGRLVFNRDFIRYYPESRDLLGDDIESFIGIRLLDKSENTIGIIGVASKQVIPDTNLAENILSIATSRAVIELEHQIEVNNNQRYQHGVDLIDDWIARLITEGYDRNAFFKNICCAAQEIVNAQLAAFPVLHADRKTYHFEAASGEQAEKLESSTHSTDDGGICSWSITHGKSLIINNVLTDPRADKQLAELFNIRSALVTPVTLKDEAYGAIAIFRTEDEFDEIDERLMTQFSQSVQMAIINMQLVHDIRSERERAEVTLHSIGDAVITTNVNGEIEYMNTLAESLTAWPLAEARNRPVQDVFRIEDLDTGEPIHDVVMSCLDEGISINKSALNLINRQGHRKGIESSISPILKTSGKAEGVVIVFHDETQRRQMEKEIRHQVAHDPLTNLLNKEAFNYQLSDHVYDAINHNRNHVLCYLDLDRFKLINDTAGHSAGDQCLIQVTSLIQSCIRNDDILGRLGGDEFGLILKNCNLEGAKKIAGNIIKAIADMTFTWEDCDYSLSVSIGINPLDANTVNAAEALRRADLACYTAKDNGKNRYYVYEEQDSELIRRQDENYWRTRIKQIIEQDMLKLYAQPVVSLSNKAGRFTHVEILARLLDEDSQLSTPESFIPSAERYNLMQLIDRQVIDRSFSLLKQLAETEDEQMHFFINISSNTLRDTDTADNILDYAKQHDIDPRHVCFEISETTVIKNLQQTRKLMRKLKPAGFRFSLDHFGSALSSLQYLKKLPVDYLKIDGLFVANMVNNTIDQAMVAAINEICHTLGIRTIAEHVENEQIISKLQALKVDYGQGYGIEQPQPVEDLLALPESKNSPSLKLVHKKP
ncbi:MAG TPA: EAL domain-containing protein [Gammaproteobacteria bacterium]|nr:EAL domain-containing protein [Gammaproteobacteria bacterium]